MIRDTPSAKLYSFEEMLQTMGFIVYTCVGCSMMPFLHQRKDIVEIKPLSGRAKRYDVVLYNVGELYVIHRIMKVREKDYVICGDHNIRCEYGIKDEQILGVMTRVIRNGKSIYPTDLGYKLYVHLWCDFFPVRVAILYLSGKAKAAGHRLKKLLFGQNKKTNE